MCACVCVCKFTASLSLYPKSVGMQGLVADLKIKMMESANEGQEGHNKKSQNRVYKDAMLAMLW